MTDWPGACFWRLSASGSTARRLDALLPVFVAVLLGALGGKPQQISHMLSGARGGFALLLGTTLLVYAIAAAGGVLVAETIPYNARSLLFALALGFGGAPMLLGLRPITPLAKPNLLKRAAWLFNAQLGDSGAFIVFAVAARTTTPALAAGGGIAAMLVAGGIPMLLAKDWPGPLPLSTLRRVAGALLLLAAALLAIDALRLT